MNSDWLTEHMLDAIDGTLSEGDSVRFEKALAEEPAARVRFGELRALVEMTRQLPSLDEPVDFTAGVMERIQHISPPWWVRLWYFLIRPYDLQVNLLAALSTAAGVTAAVALGMNLFLQSEPAQTPLPADAARQYVIQFIYNDPQAKQVFVAGSFNDWQKEQIPLTDNSGKGTWIGVVPMKPGLYEYMFYVDGRWASDSHALRYKDDGFGRKNAILELGTGDDISI
jgi:hypothetical protein